MEAENINFIERFFKKAKRRPEELAKAKEK
jgi:hypothetical protein